MYSTLENNGTPTMDNVHCCEVPCDSLCDRFRKLHDMTREANATVNYISSMLFGPKNSTDEAKKDESPSCLSEDVDLVLHDMRYLADRLALIKGLLG